MYHKKELQELMRIHSSMKTLQLLVVLVDCEGEISLVQFSAATGIPPSSTHRVLQEMQHCGFVTKDEVKKRYRAGFEACLLVIQLQKTNFLYKVARGEMVYLSDPSLGTIHLIGEEGIEAIYLAKLGVKSSVGLHSAVGKRILLYYTGGGKAILAWKSESWLENYLVHVKRERFTSKILTGAEDLRWELEVIWIQGYAMDNHEHHTNVVCIVAPVLDVNNQVLTAIGIAAPDHRFSLEKALFYFGEILRCVAHITKKLGWHCPVRVSKRRDEGDRFA